MRFDGLSGCCNENRELTWKTHPHSTTTKEQSVSSGYIQKCIVLKKAQRKVTRRMMPQMILQRIVIVVQGKHFVKDGGMNYEQYSGKSRDCIY